MFPNFTLTKDGEILLNSCIGARKTITFTRIKLGKGDLGIEEIRDMKDIVQSFKEIPILETQVLENKMTKIVSFFDNKDLKEDVLWKEIGVFAQIGEQTETEILYSYSNAGEEGVLIPSNERSTSFRRTLDLRNYIGYATDISFVINEIKDHYQFNTLSEMKVATYLKKGDKVSLWGDTVIGNKELRLYIVQEEEAEVELSNGLYAKLYLDESLKQNIEDKRLNTEDKTIVGAINEKLNQGTVPTTLNSAEKIVAALQATTGLKFDPNKLYLNDPGINEEGFCYLDRLRDGIFKCLVRNEDGVNDLSKFEDISNKANSDRLDNLFKVNQNIDGWEITHVIGKYYLCCKALIANQSASIIYNYPFEIELNRSLLHVQSQRDVLCYVNRTSNNTSDIKFTLDNNSSNEVTCYCEFLLYKK